MEEDLANKFTKLISDCISNPNRSSDSFKATELIKDNEILKDVSEVKDQ